MNTEKELQICKHFENTAELIGFELNPSISSCNVIENILQGLASLGDSGALQGAKFSAGVYLGKIIKEKIGGSWQLINDQEQLSLNIDGTIVFPHNAVDNFVDNPDENSILFYVESVIASKISNKAN